MLKLGKKLLQDEVREPEFMTEIIQAYRRSDSGYRVSDHHETLIITPRTQSLFTIMISRLSQKYQFYCKNGGHNFVEGDLRDVESLESFMDLAEEVKSKLESGYEYKDPNPEDRDLNSDPIMMELKEELGESTMREGQKAKSILVVNTKTGEQVLADTYKQLSAATGATQTTTSKVFNSFAYRYKHYRFIHLYV